MKGYAPPATRRPDDGFTVVEVVIALSILLIALMGLVTAMSFSAQAAQSTEVRMRAVNLANERIERARNLAYDDVGLTYSGGGFGTVPGSILTPETVGEFVVATDIDWARDPVTMRAEYKRITVTIGWSHPSSGTISVSSAIFGKSELVNVGDVEVTVLERETNVPIPGATVEVAPSDAGALVRTGITGADGKTFYGFVESGSAALTASASGYVFDLADYSAIQVVPDSLTSITILGQRPSTINYTVTDASNAPIPGASVTIDGVKKDPVTILTDSSGVASFTGLIIDTYAVTITAGTRVPYSGSVPITTQGSTVSRTVRMGSVALPGALKVIVTAQSGVQLSNATVRVYGPLPSSAEASGSPGVTGTTGEWVNNSLTAGDYTVSVSRAGYDTRTGLATTLVSGSTTTLNVTLIPSGGGATTGTLRCYIYDRDGDPIVGHDLVIVIGNKKSTKTSNSSGYVEWTGLNPGSYNVYIDKDKSVSQTSQVNAGQTTIVSLTHP